MPKSSFVAYIDESGDEGFFFDRGSSEWFVLSVVITRKENDLATVKVIDEIREQLGRKDKNPFHFRNVKHTQRIPYIDKIAKAPLRTISVLVHKPSLKEPETFQQRYRLYYYCVRYLLERVSWFCRDHQKKNDIGDGTVEIVFSNRAGMKYKEIRDYLLLLKEQTRLMDVRIDWSVIKPALISSYGPDKRMGLQIADAVASSFYFAVERRYGFTEDRYANMLKPIVYQNKGRFIGYGLKFWPKELEVLSDERLAWVENNYKK